MDNTFVSIGRRALTLAVVAPGGEVRIVQIVGERQPPAEGADVTRAHREVLYDLPLESEIELIGVGPLGLLVVGDPGVGRGGIF